jgi:predicted dehydrogenase
MRAHIPALRSLPDFEPVAVATTSDATAREAAAACGIPHAFGDARQLVESPEVDVVAVCVRVPRHLELVAMALAAGKHVYCEWPLGRNTAEGLQLAAAASDAGVCHIVGLQGRRSPTIEYVRDLIAAGEIGRVRACSLNHSVPWPNRPPAQSAYLQTIESGANFLTIPAGHSIDTVTDLLGPFEKLAAVSLTQEPQVSIRDSNETLRRTSPDQIAMVGVLTGGVVASLRFQGASRHGTGIRLEINGELGELIVAPVSPQASMLQIWDLALYRSNGLGTLEPVVVPERYFDVPLGIRSGPPLNVARTYLALGRAIRGSGTASPDFEAAVALHRTLDALVSSANALRPLELQPPS